VLMAVVSLSAAAQDKKQQTLTEVRALYSKALADIKQREGECHECMDKITVSNDQMLGGTGRHQKTTTFYFSQDFDEEAGGDITYPKFIRLNYNYAARTYLEEYLYDEYGNMVFAFIKENDEPATETRVYVKNGIAILDKKVTSAPQSHPVNMQVVSTGNEDVKKASDNSKKLVAILKSLVTTY